jgi:hypothetical protein
MKIKRGKEGILIICYWNFALCMLGLLSAQWIILNQEIPDEVRRLMHTQLH